MDIRTGILGLALVLGMASSGCAAVGASMRVSGSVDSGAIEHAMCEIGPGNVPTAVRWTPAERQQLESDLVAFAPTPASIRPTARYTDAQGKGCP